MENTEIENKKSAEPKKELWFRAKRYGYGWFPTTWQGWGILLMYLFALIPDFVFINNHTHSNSDMLMQWFPHFFILTVFLIIICDAKGGTNKMEGKER